MSEAAPGRPVQVLDQVWLVGSGTETAVLTHECDCHCYLIWDGTGGFLIDGGTGLGFDRLMEAVSEICDPALLGGCLVTHYHADHAGAAAQFAARGIPVFGSSVTAEALKVGDEQRTQLANARRVGVYPPDYRLEPAPITVLTDGEVVRSGGIAVEMLETPGHCDGHAVYATEIAETAMVFTGDCLFAGGTVSLQAIPDCRLDRYAESVIRLAERNFDAMLPGHGELVLSEASSPIRSAAGSFARLIPPPNFLS